MVGGFKMNATIYVNKKTENILKDVPGENISQKISFLANAYVDQRGK